MKRELTLTLRTDGAHVTAVDVRLPRLDATALLQKRSASAAMVLLPTVFSICAQAQGAAAAGALLAARGKALPSALMRGHTLAVQLESVQESLRALCLGLPEALRSPGTPYGALLMADFSRAWRDGMALLARLQKILHRGAEDVAPLLTTFTGEVQQVATTWDGFCEKHVYGVSAWRWRGEADIARIADEATPVMRWFRQMAAEVPTLGCMTQTPLPLAAFHSGVLPWRTLTEMPYDASAWRRVRNDPRLLPVAERLRNSIAARLWARLIDVAQTLTALCSAQSEEQDKMDSAAAAPWIRTYPLGPGEGMAEVECARGVLLHRVTMAQQEIVTYEICAPTDWNLHQEGALTTLIGMPAADPERLRTYATWLVQVLDPCVVFDIEIHDEIREASHA